MTAQRNNRRAKKPAPKPSKKVTPKKITKVIYPAHYKFTGTDGKEYVLTPKQKNWVDVYLEKGANLTRTTLETYEVKDKGLCVLPWGRLNSKEKKRRAIAENVASSIGTENLRKPQISAYINKILTDEGYTEEVVRLEHFKNIKQDESLPAKNQAIDMYYKKMGKYPRDEGEKDFYEKAAEFFDGVRKALPK